MATTDGARGGARAGEVPSYRDLSTSSTDGIDIRQLETNLVLLGFDPDGEVAIDEEYDSATAAAVTLWEDSLGLDGDGIDVTERGIVDVWAALRHDRDAKAAVRFDAFGEGRPDPEGFDVVATVPVSVSLPSVGL